MHGWQARVIAWDLIQAKAIEERWLAREIASREADWATGEELRATARELLRGAELFRVTRRDVEELEDGTVRETLTLEFKPRAGDIAALAKTGSDLQQRALQAPTDRVEYTGAALDAVIEGMRRKLGKDD